MVELMVIPLTYLPLATDGLAFSTALMTVIALSISFFGSNDSLRRGHVPARFIRAELDLAALISLIAETTSVVTVPVLDWASTLRPQHLAQPSDQLHHVGRGNQRVEGGPVLFLDLLHQLVATANSAPAASASAILSPEVMTATILSAQPMRRTTVPRTIWSACLGSTPRRIFRSTVSSNLAYLAF